MILIIDNYDSFTYNVVHAIAAMGHEVVVALHDQISLVDIEHKKPSHIIISPGPCSPNEAGISNAVIKHFHQQLPILGICLGHQCLAQAFGANIIRAPQVKHGKTAAISHNNQGIFQQLPQPFTATRYHSLIVDAHTTPDCFKVTAWTKDNEDTIIMGLQHQHLPLYGLQFHPESILTECGDQLFANFLKDT